MTQQSNTPETDDHISSNMAICEHAIVCHDFARKLERERDEARKLYEKQCEGTHSRMAEIVSLRAQNQTFRNAQKACEDCDAPTMEEVNLLRKVADELRECISTFGGHGMPVINDRALCYAALNGYDNLPHVIARKESKI